MDQEKLEKAIEKLMDDKGLSWCDECKDWYDQYHQEWAHKK